MPRGWDCDLTTFQVRQRRAQRERHQGRRRAAEPSDGDSSGSVDLSDAVEDGEDGVIGQHDLGFGYDFLDPIRCEVTRPYLGRNLSADDSIRPVLPPDYTR